MTAVFEDAKSLREKMIEWRRAMHRHPELGHEEVWTSSFIRERLTEIGVAFHFPVGATGLWADIKVPSAKKTIALRADFDALPIQEENDLPYKSEIQGKAHLCGHDAHTAMLLGAATILKKNHAALKNNVRLIFQHAEELWEGGASDFMQAGIMRGVDEVYALHNDPLLQAGTIGANNGRVAASCGYFEIRVIGRGGHGAYPHQCLDPVPVAAQIILAAQTIISRRISATDAGIITFGKLSGGTVFNAIPDEVVLTGTTRSFSTVGHQAIAAHLQEISKGISAAHGMACEFKWESSTPPVVNNAAASDRVRSAAKLLGDGKWLITEVEPMMIADDFAFFGEAVPSCYFLLGTQDQAQQVGAPLHSPRYRFNEDMLPVGAAMLAQLALA